jgi:hypothetical protein
MREILSYREGAKDAKEIFNKLLKEVSLSAYFVIPECLYRESSNTIQSGLLPGPA